jgi:hypothetical protein
VRILFVVDGRSPIALNWIEYFTKGEHEVHLISTIACQPDLKLASIQIVPVAFSATAGETTRTGRGLRGLFPPGLRTQLRSWVGPFTLGPATKRLQELIDETNPDLVHAMRIPYEGMLAAATQAEVPLMVSVWGNDFTLHARANPFMAAATRKTMQRAAALHTDTKRDQRLAAEWGFDRSKPALMVPGSGGVRPEIFYPAKTEPRGLRVVNPRGLRAYVRNDVFFKAIPKVLRQLPEVRFDCPGMQGKPEALRWVQKLGIEQQVNLLPHLSAWALAETYRAAQVLVSPSTHDGTPNSLLESMACEVFPICGDLESIREWVRDGENGLLVDPGDPDALSAAILNAFRNEHLRERAAGINKQLITERANYPKNMERANAFYSDLA